MHYCEVIHCSVYDATYLAIADVEGIPIITSNERLFRTVKKERNT